MLHWVNTELWAPMWPNLAASAFCSALVYVRLRVHQRRQHEDMKRHVTATAGAGTESGAR